MSIEIHVFMHDSRVPTRESWQRVIEELNFSTVLDESLDVRGQTGFLPAVHNGQSTGFEFDVEPAVSFLDDYSHIVDRVGERTMCATFRWSSDLTEMAAALSAAAALTRLTDGIYFSPDDDGVYGADEVVEAVRSELASL